MLSALLVTVSMLSTQLPGDAAARAIAAIRDGRDTEARALIAAATEALAKAPIVSHWRTWQEIGIAHLMLGSHDEAARIFKTLLDAADRDQEIRDAALTGLGRVALASHDPAAAIRHFERVETREGHHWLAAALMMESRSPSDEYVERAFDAALRARMGLPGDVRPRADIAASLRPGEMVIAFLVGESHAYAWAFERDAFIGYPLPKPGELATAAGRAQTYFDQNDKEGLGRVAENLMPALLGPATDRLPTLQRLIFVPDDTLQGLPFADLPIAGAEEIAVSVINGPLSETAIRDAAQRRQSGGRSTMAIVAGIGLLIAIVAGVSRLALRRSRARS
jgi:tetratricopeptide (TPR) repeat protein